jgi:hypothetical protein
VVLAKKKKKEEEKEKERKEYFLLSGVFFTYACTYNINLCPGGDPFLVELEIHIGK